MLLITEGGIGGKFIFIQNECCTLRVDPDIQQQIHLLDMIVEDSGRFRDIAVPAFLDAACTGDIKNIEPAIRVIVLNKLISWFKGSIAQVLSRLCPTGLNDYSIS